MKLSKLLFKTILFSLSLNILFSRDRSLNNDFQLIHENEKNNELSMLFLPEFLSLDESIE
jgi:hypothetical protein